MADRRVVIVYPNPAKVGTPYFDGITEPTDDYEFVPWSPRRAFRGRYDLVHIHWPESVWGKESLVAGLVRGTILLALLTGARLRHKPVVYTLHNLEPHEIPHPTLDRIMQAAFERTVSRVQVLSDHGALEVETRLGGKVPSDLVRIGVEPSNHIRNPGLQAGPVGRILHFGFIREYKDVPLLIETFRSVQTNEAWRLSVVGNVATSALRESIEGAARGADNVSLRLEFIAESDIPGIHAGACLVVLPYRRIENSSSILTALEYSVPVLAPRLGALPELQEIVGDRWVRLYDGEFDAGVLLDAMMWARRTKRVAPPELEQFDWRLVRGQRDQSYDRALVSIR